MSRPGLGKSGAGAGNSEEDESALLPGEKKILQIPESVYVFFKGTRSRRSGAEEALLTITNFRIMLAEKMHGGAEGPRTQGLVSVPLATILEVKAAEMEEEEEIFVQMERIDNSERTCLTIECKDFRSIYISFKAESMKDAKKCLQKLVAKQDQNFCYHSLDMRLKNVAANQDGWYLLNLETEIKRQKLNTKLWRVSEVNKDAKINEAYPKQVVVPGGISDSQLKKLMKTTSISLTWRNTRTKGTLVRVDTKKEKKGEHSALDAETIAAVRESIETEKLNILNCREAKKKKEEAGAGAGDQEAQTSVGKSDALIVSKDTRKALNKFLDICMAGKKSSAMSNYTKSSLSKSQKSRSKSKDKVTKKGQNKNVVRTRESKSSISRSSKVLYDTDEEWMAALQNSLWLKNTRAILSSALVILDSLEAGESVMLNGTAFAAQLAQVSSLAQICSDAYYRTITGFAVLVEKEWSRFGYNWGQRSDKKSKKADPRAGGFLQFIECVWQLWNQFPGSFEFNEEFLLFVVDSVYNARFGTFMFDTEKQRISESATEKTISMWTYTQTNKDLFFNPFYTSKAGAGGVEAVSLRPRLDHITVWNAYYLRWVCHKALRDARSSIEKTGQSLYFASAGGAVDTTSEALSGIGLHVIPKQMGASMMRLNKVDLSGNYLNTFSPHLGKMANLKSLSLGNNYISTLAISFVLQLKRLVELDLNNNRLSEVPKDFGLLVNLRALYLDGNGIEELPESITALTNLHRLSLNNNKLSGRIPQIEKMVKLSQFSINGNKITDFPNAIIENLKAFKSLDVGKNDLDRFPSTEIVSLAALQSFNICHNPNIADKIETLQFNSNLTNLNLRGLTMDFFLEGRKKLDQFMQSSRLKLLSAASQGGSRSDLFKSDSRVGFEKSTSITESAPRLPRASSALAESRRASAGEIAAKKGDDEEDEQKRSASFSEDQPSATPLAWVPLSAFWQGVSNVRVLDLTKCDITLIPFEIFRLSKLQKLYLSKNKISEIPEEILHLKELTELTLAKNNLTVIPQEIGHLRNLVYLNLKRNNIESLPATLGFLEKLKDPADQKAKTGLKLPTAALKFPPRDVVERGVADVLSFLRQAFKGTTKTFCIKLMLVGQENVGKTSILRCLNKVKAAPKGAPETISTDGIDIEKWQLDVEFKSGPSPVDVSVWDFAGQEIYYTSHQFFLSERSIYLIVFNLVNKHSRDLLEHWLHSIATRGRAAPVIIVGTHKDDPAVTETVIDETLQEILSKYRRKFKAIKNVLFVSCSTGDGFTQLRESISKAIAGVPGMGQEIPNSYFQLQQMILAERAKKVPPVLLWEEYRNLGFLCGILSEPDLLTATSFLHNWGSLVYFEKDENLSNIIILDPQWLTKVMSTVLTTKHRYVREGILNYSALLQIWRAPDYPEHLHEFLISLLNRFEISFEASLPSEEQKGDVEDRFLLVPSLLPDDRPNTKMMQDIFDEFDGKKISSPSSPGPAAVSVKKKKEGKKKGEKKGEKKSEKKKKGAAEGEKGKKKKAGKKKGTKHRKRLPEEGKGDWYQLGRIYYFDFLPTGFFSRVMSRVFSREEFSVKAYWRRGIFFTAGFEKILIEAFPLENKLTVQIRKKELTKEQLSSLNQDHVITPLVYICSTIDALVEDWYQTEVDVRVLCSHCLSKRPEISAPYLFPLHVCKQATIHNEEHIYCKKGLPQEKEEKPFYLRDQRDKREGEKKEDSKTPRKTSPRKEEGTAVSLIKVAPDVSMQHMKSSRLDYDDLEFGAPLGEGSFAFVFKGAIKTKHSVVAIKKLKAAKNVTDLSIFDEFSREIWIMSGLSHPNITKFHGFTIDPCCIIVEFVGGGDLFSFVLKTRIAETLSYWPCLLMKIAKDIAKGCAYLHGMTPPVIHRDLKSPNVLLVNTAQGATGIVAKVSDFGTAQHMEGVTAGRKVDNPVWLAPEVLKNEKYTEKADVYSFGVILWEMVAMQQFFEGEKFMAQLEKKVLSGLRPDIPSTCNPEIADLIRDCWQGSADKRPSFSVVALRLRDIMMKYYPDEADYDDM